MTLLSDEQANLFARQIKELVVPYVRQHWDDYQRWLTIEQHKDQKFKDELLRIKERSI